MFFNVSWRASYLTVFAAAALALLYNIQPIFFWFNQHIPLAHPFFDLSALIVLALMPACFVQWRRLLQSLVLPDYALFLFVLYAIFRLFLQHDLESQTIMLIGSAAIVYLLARIVGYWRADIFLWSFIACGVFSLVITLPELLFHLKASESVERIIFYGEIIGNRWPAFAIGGMISAGLVLTQSETNRARVYLLAIAMGMLCWIPLFIGARSVVVSIMITAVIMCFVSRADIRKKITILVVALSVAIAGIGLLPEKRLDLYKQLSSAVRGMPLPSNKVGEYSNDKGAIAESMVVTLSTHSLTGRECVVQGNSIIIRKILIADGLRAFVSSPIFGIGVDTYKMFNCVRTTTAYIPAGDPHMSVLHVAAELGILGFILFIFAIGWIVWQQRKYAPNDAASYRVASGCFALWLFQLVHDQFNTSYISGTNYYLVTGLMIGLYSSLLREKK